jgi:Uma2 family endonuclease
MVCASKGSSGIAVQRHQHTLPSARRLCSQSGAAFLVVEVLSEADVMTAVIEKLKEYAAKGVENIWLIDPRLRNEIFAE